MRTAQVWACGRASRSSERERLRETRTETDPSEDAGSKYVRERMFLLKPSMLGATGKASERERKRDACNHNHGSRHRETSIWVEKKFY